MNDLISRLSTLSAEPSAPSEATVAADVRRGRRAQLRRRAVRSVTGGALALAVAGTAVAVVHDGDATTAPQARPSAHAAGGVRLVDYTGPQPAGFTVRTVPAGFVLQGVKPSVLDITRPGDKSDIYSFVGKIVVSLQSKDARFQARGTEVSVNGQTGYIHDEPGAATTLEYLDAAGHDVIVQAWDTLGLTDDQLVQLAEGVTVTPDAVAPVG